MSNYHKHSWVIFPLLSILSMSPAELTTRHHASRQMASVVENEGLKSSSEHPLFDKLVSKVDKTNTAKETSIDKFLEKTGSINDQLKKEREVFKKNIDKKEEVAKQRKGLEGFVSDVVVLEEELKILKDKKLLLEEDEKFVTKSIEDFKKLSEDLLIDLDQNEKLVAKTEEPKKEEAKKEEVLPELAKAEAPVAPVVAEVPKVEEPKKEEETKVEVPVAPVAKEEPKKEEPVKVEVASKEEPKKEEEDKKEENKKEVAKKKEKDDCEKEGKDKVLTPQANELAAQQSLIMQQMMAMTQMLMMTLQQQQMQIFQMQQQHQLQGPVNQQAYQYIAPTNGGQWVFQPSGGNRPGLYPDQMGQQMPFMQQAPQGYNGWNLAPNNYFQNQQQWTPMQVQPGNFGGPAIGFNMQQPILNTPGPMGMPMGPMGQMPMMQPQMGPQTFQI